MFAGVDSIDTFKIHWSHFNARFVALQYDESPLLSSFSPRSVRDPPKKPLKRNFSVILTKR